uniref:Uncharacterized protein n=1 Tax=Arundo donax TaxID=35708 RepID=A0A0A9U177_ARUDO
MIVIPLGGFCYRVDIGHSVFTHHDM